MRFLRLQGKRRVEKEYWAYDSTSISSYSESLKQVKYGKNKDGEKLPQINLALIFGENSGLPFYYRKLAGNIPDVKTIRELLRELDVLGYEKIKLVMDRGYYSADNINALYKEHLKFLCSTSAALKFAKDYIREIGADKDYRKYFEVKETPKRGISLSYKQEAIDSVRERYGFFVLISNEVKDPVIARSLYKMHDVIEKAFWNIKERLNLRRTLTSSESSLEGKLFVEFVALIYLSYIKKKMEEAGLFSRYTMQELLDELDIIECFQEPGKAPIQGEVLKKQEQIYRNLGVEPLLATPEIK